MSCDIKDSLDNLEPPTTIGILSNIPLPKTLARLYVETYLPPNGVPITDERNREFVAKDTEIQLEERLEELFRRLQRSS